MRKFLFSLAVVLLLLAAPFVLAVNVGSGVTPVIDTEDFAPRVWMCDTRVVYDDATEPGRVSQDNETLIERINNYAFEGEQIHWTVLVMDKNKIDQNIDVYATVGDVQGEGNEIEVNCLRSDREPRDRPHGDYNRGRDWDHDGYVSTFESCNARIDEEYVQWNEDTMSFFECTFTVETPESMYGEYWITVEAQDGDGNMGAMDENEYWFLNPVVALDVRGALTFNDVRPGTQAYSNTLLVGNDADAGSGVL